MELLDYPEPSEASTAAGPLLAQYHKSYNAKFSAEWTPGSKHAEGTGWASGHVSEAEIFSLSQSRRSLPEHRGKA